MTAENNLARCTRPDFSLLKKKFDDVVYESLQSSRILKFPSERVWSIAWTLRDDEYHILSAFGDLLRQFVVIENGIDVIPPSMKMYDDVDGIGLTESLWNEDGDAAIAVMLIRRELLVSICVSRGALRMGKGGR